MRSAFDIIGPIMIGPSSSHTAGAVRLGLMARAILGEEVKICLLYTSPSPRDRSLSRMPSSA